MDLKEFYTLKETRKWNLIMVPHEIYEKMPDYFICTLENVVEWSKDDVWLFKPSEGDLLIAKELGWAFIEKEHPNSDMKRRYIEIQISKEEFLERARKGCEKRELDWDKVKSRCGNFEDLK